MAILFIICILIIIAFLSFAIFYAIKGIFKKEFSYIKTGLICFGIALFFAILMLWNITEEIAEAYTK